MSSRVFVHPGLLHVPYIDRIAVGIALFHDTGKYPDFLGHFGQFENNPTAMGSLLHKIHLALYNQGVNWKRWKHRNGHNRTSDNFVIYVRHFFCDDCYLILDIVSPDAHSKIDSLLPKLIEQAENFHKLKKNDFHRFTEYDSSNYQIADTITLTD